MVALSSSANGSHACSPTHSRATIPTLDLVDAKISEQGIKRETVQNLNTEASIENANLKKHCKSLASLFEGKHKIGILVILNTVKHP